MSLAELPQPELADFNPLGMAFRSCPHAFFPHLVRASPGLITPEGEPSAFVASWADCTNLMRDYKRFSSVRPKTPSMEKVDFFNSTPVMTYSDPPMHTRLRRLVSNAFSPKRVMQMREATLEIVGRLMDEAARRGRLEVMADLAHPLATELLLGHFMGVKREDYPIFMNFKSSLNLLNFIKPGEGKPQGYKDAWAAGVDYCVRAIERARRDKTEDLIGLVVAANEQDGRLSDDEMFAMVFVLFSGGISTLASHTGLSLMNLARRPELTARLAADGEDAERFFEEVMRYDPGVLVALRFPTEDLEFEGVPLKAGMPVYVIHSAAGWDPGKFPDPAQFDIDRPNVKEHLNFGHGIHTCIGNNIIRATIPIVLQETARRFPDLRMTEPGFEVVFGGTPRSRMPEAIPLSL